MKIALHTNKYTSRIRRLRISESLKSGEFEIVLRNESGKRELHIGRGIETVNIPHITDMLFDIVTIDERNPWLRSFGGCIYSATGKTLLRCAVRESRCTVASGTEAIASEAFAYNTMLEEIVLPEGLETIEERAFSGSALKQISMPSSLRKICARAFSNCHSLKEVELNEGLELIGDSAFSGCDQLKNVLIPKTVKEIHVSSFTHARNNSEGRISIDSENPCFLLDRGEVLYRRLEDGLELMGEMGKVSGTYRVVAGTRRIEDAAFRFNQTLLEVVLPEGLEKIGDFAFKGCDNLRCANFPSTIKSIGNEAFLSTNLESIHIPASLSSIGELAFSCRGGGWERNPFPVVISTFGLTRTRAKPKPKAKEGSCLTTVEDGNERYCIANGFLCERLEDGTLCAIKYIAHDESVSVPRQVVMIEREALVDARSVRTLQLHDGVRKIRDHGLFITHPLLKIMATTETTDVDFEVYPVQSYFGVWAQNHAFIDGKLDLELLAYDCDYTLYHSQVGFERSWRMLSRLCHPLFLSEELNERFNQELHSSLLNLVADFSRRDYLEGLRQLFDVGLIDNSNIYRCIDAANRSHGVSATGFLMEESHRRLSEPTIDLSL
ncbi:MAG: leucine-rich repeat domain-containing protein [Coriobacteriales bacterium]|jgi:hypothetical protein